MMANKIASAGPKVHPNLLFRHLVIDNKLWLVSTRIESRKGLMGADYI